MACYYPHVSQVFSFVVDLVQKDHFLRHFQAENLDQANQPPLYFSKIARNKNRDQILGFDWNLFSIILPFIFFYAMIIGLAATMKQKQENWNAMNRFYLLSSCFFLFPALSVFWGYEHVLVHSPHY